MGKQGDELMNLETYTVLMEADILIEYWLIEYNQVRSHRALDYFPHFPEAIMLKILT